jgi:hypothetical protein
VVLFNNRADRLRRARDLAPLFGDGIHAAKIVVAGEATAQFIDLLRGRVPTSSIVDAGGLDAAALKRLLIETSPAKATIIGVGNIGGVGLNLLSLIEGRAAA